MDKQKISKILIITSIATGVTLSGAFLIYKHNKENKQYKRNSNSNFSITIHLSKDFIPKELSEEEEINEIADIDDYLSELPDTEEKNFFLNLFDKFINIFSKKEELSEGNDTIIITKPNEALFSSLDDTVEIDENNDTIIITKPNEASTSSPIEGHKENIKILNEVIEQTIKHVNSSGSESDDNMGTIKKNFGKKNFGKKIITTPPSISSSSSVHPLDQPTTSTSNSNYNINATGSEPLSAQSSTSTLIGKHEASEELQNSSFDNSFTMKIPDQEIINTESGGEGELEDNVSDHEVHSPHTPANRKRKETITNFNYKKNDEINDSENELVAPSTPKLNFADQHTFSPMPSIHRTPQTNGKNNNTAGENDSINPLSIDINKILMTQNFEFSDEEDNGNTTSDTIDHFIPKRKNGKTLHRASSISSTSTFQSATSSWTGDNQSILEDHLNPTPHDINDDKWEVNSACSSTSGFYSAQEEFFDATFE